MRGSLGSFGRAELLEEVMSVLNYSLNTYSVCPELGTQRESRVPETMTTNK